MLETRRTPRHRGVTLLLLGAALTLVLGVLTAVVGAVVSGAPAALGALVGAGLVVVVCTLGGLVVTTVAAVSPGASLLVGLMTYTLQVAVLLLAFVALQRSGLLGSELDRVWLGGAVVGATLLWLSSQVVAATTARIPAYDLGTEADDR